MTIKLPKWNPDDVLYCEDCEIVAQKSKSLVKPLFGQAYYECPKCEKNLGTLVEEK